MQLDLHVVIETSRLCLVQCLYAWLSCGLLISDIHMQCHIIVSWYCVTYSSCSNAHTHTHTCNSFDRNSWKLETLKLERNFLTSLPDSLIYQKDLKKVILSDIELKCFPFSLCQLTHLAFAGLSSNSLESLLNLNYNSITVLPCSITCQVQETEGGVGGGKHTIYIELGCLPDVILTGSIVFLFFVLMGTCLLQVHIK